MKYIGLLDCNNFFVSCERLFRPDLRHRPVVVLSSNDGCIVARSAEVKTAGIPMGAPYFKVKDNLKDIKATVFSSNFTLYRDISRRVFEVMRDEIGDIEQYSIDEAFIEIQSQQVTEIMARLKDRIEQHVGVPVSLGLGLSKTQAKYANDVAKRTNGLHILDVTSWQSEARTIPLSAIWGVGYRLGERYKQAGINTVADLLVSDRQRIATLFGVAGIRLKEELAGKSHARLQTRLEPQKSIMSSRSFRDITTDIDVVKDALAYHVRHAAADLRAMGLCATRLAIALKTNRYSDFVLQNGHANTVLTAPSDNTFLLLQEALKLLESVYTEDVPYKKVGVILSDLVSSDVTQSPLFETASLSHADTTLLQTIDRLNKKMNRELVLVGSRLKMDTWSSKCDKRSPAYTTAWKQLRTVSTEAVDDICT